MNAAEIALVAEEAERLAGGGRVQRVYDRLPAGVGLEVRVPGATRHLLVVAEPPLTWMALADERPRHPDQPTELVRQLRQRLEGARLERVEVAPGDRVVRFATSGGGLVAELTGAHGNLAFVDDEGAVRALAHTVRSGRRTLVPGGVYEPPGGGAAGPAESGPAMPGKEGGNGGPARGAQRTQPDERGGGDAVRAAGGSGELAGARQGPAEIWRRDRLDLASLPPDGSRSRAVVAHFEPREEEAFLEQARSELGRKLRRAEKGLAHRVRELERDLEAAERAEHDRRAAEGIVALGRPRERGHQSVEVIDYEDASLPRFEVEVDPASTLQENVERLFKRHRKLTRSRPTLEARLPALRQSLESVREARRRLPELATQQDVARLARELLSAGRLSERAVGRPEELAAAGAPGRRRRGAAAKGAAAKGRKEPPRALPYRTYTSKTGREILVGRGSKANDELSLKVARGADAWLHAEGAAGSHVVLRLQRGEEPDRESLLDAATLAAHFSQGPKTGKVGVIWTRAARVRKPKGLKPGLVEAAGTKSLAFRLDPDRLARLLGRDKPSG